MTLQLQTAASGIARSAHYVIPTGQTVPIQTLLLEPSRNNLVLRSEQFNDAAWTATNVTVTANAIAAPDNATTAELLNATVNGGSVVQAVTFTGNAEKCAAIYLKAGTAAATDIQLWDDTAPSASRHLVRATWSGGVPTLSTVSGAGTLYPVEAVGNGWYRILFSATGVLAASTNQIRIFPAAASTGTVYAWGAQAENAVTPTSYVKTEGTTITRNADSLYLPYTAVPQAMSVYVRGVQLERASNVGTTFWLWGIGASSGTGTPRLGVFLSTNGYSCVYENTTQSTSGAFGTSAVRGDIIELNAQLSATAQNRLIGSINGGAETTSNFAGTQALASAWADQRLYIGSFGSQPGAQFAFTHVFVAAGNQSLSTMRQLAGVV